MSHPCPHCHEPLPDDPASGMPPATCTLCGGDIQASPVDPVDPVVPSAAEGRAVPAARSLASFLRWNKPGSSATPMPRMASENGAAAPATNVEMQQDESGGAAESPGAADSPVQDEPARVSASADPADGPRGVVASESAESIGEGETPDAARELQRAIVDEAPAPVLVLDRMDEVNAASQPAASRPIGAPPPHATAQVVPAEDAATPDFTFAPQEPNAASPTRAWQWAALVVLALALVLQILLADRARLAADAQWRPLLNSMCGMFGCSLPTWHEPDAFTMLGRDVRPAPQTPGALQVQATFRNDARWHQQWPVMRLSLSDADGRVVGARAFVPSEYLEPALTQTTLAPGQSAQVMLQVREPEASVVAFSFDFD